MSCSWKVNKLFSKALTRWIGWFRKKIVRLEYFNPINYLSLLRKQPKTFAFDHCFFSTDPNASNFASQDIVFDSVGRDILDNAFQGYNACIFAYGQTGELKKSQRNFLLFLKLSVVFFFLLKKVPENHIP